MSPGCNVSITLVMITFRLREPDFPWFRYNFKPVMIYLTPQEWCETARRNVSDRKKMYESYYGEDLVVNIHNRFASPLER